MGSLSEETIKSLRTPDKGNSITYFAGATIQGAKAPRGFGVRVTASGARAFILNYRLRGREHRFTIGAWPDWSALKAVREARNLRQRVDRGEDPLKDRAPIPTTKSVSSAIDDFMTRYVRNKERPLRSADQIESAFDRLVKPRIGKIGIYELRRSHVAEMLDRAASHRSNSLRGGFLYSAFAETFRAFRGIDFATRLRWLFDLLKPRAIAGRANNLSQHFTRSFHRDQSLKTKQKLNYLGEDSG